VVAAGDPGFRGQPSAPPVAPDVVPDLDEALVVHGLHGEPAVADELPRLLEHHRPQPEPLFGVVPEVPFDPPDRLGA
jgi:hypothetical protein